MKKNVKGFTGFSINSQDISRFRTEPYRLYLNYSIDHQSWEDYKNIDEFLSTLNKTNRYIFVRRFWYLDSYEDIAKFLGIKNGAVRIRLTRVKAQLKKHLESKGVVI